VTEVFTILQSAIYEISTFMLYPVMVILLGLVTWSIIELGGFVFEFRFRDRDLKRMEHGALMARKSLWGGDPIGAVRVMAENGSNYFVHNFIKNLQNCVGNSSELRAVKVEKLIQDYETAMQRRLEKTRFLTRAGPMFGLMGTLIPMGPALMGLIRGDVEALANNLVIAFGTTVVGLMAGVTGFMVSMVRSRWYRQDMSDIQYISEVMFSDFTSESGMDASLSDLSEPASYATPNIPSNIPLSSDERNPKIGGIIRTVAMRLGESVYYTLFFTPTRLIVAKTAGSLFASPLIFMSLVISVDALAIGARVFEIAIPFSYLVLINSVICAALIAVIRVSRVHAGKKSDQLMHLHPDEILTSDAANREISYQDIVCIEVTRRWYNRAVKVLTKNDQWIDLGCIERSQLNSIGIINATLPGRIIER